MSLLCTVSEIYRHIGRKSPILIYPISIWCPHCGWSCWNFAGIFGIRKTESLGYCVALFVWS